MKTLVTAIQKGGQGKTFATCHLACDFQERGLRVAVIDLRELIPHESYRLVYEIEGARFGCWPWCIPPACGRRCDD